jgi:hypothetical protein
MEEQKIENFGGEPAGQMPAPAPMPSNVVEPQQPVNSEPIAAPEVERMQMPMQPVDVSAQPSGITMQMESSTTGGGNKKVIIIGAVVIGLLIVGGGAFFIWKSMNQPAPETPVTEQASAPITVPAVTTTETVAVPAAPELDAISTIEQDLNTFNVGGIDAEVEANLSEINKSL